MDESGGSGAVTLRLEDVLHIPDLGFDGLIGYSPIAMAMATEEYGAASSKMGRVPAASSNTPM